MHVDILYGIGAAGYCVGLHHTRLEYETCDPLNLRQEEKCRLGLCSLMYKKNWMSRGLDGNFIVL